MSSRESAFTCPGVPWISVIGGKLMLLLFLLAPIAASAHVGSPDFYYDGYAGPYHLLVTVRPPAVVPGIAEIQIRSLSTQVNQIEILPLRLIGQGAKLAPTPDVTERSKGDPQLFTGKLWLMTRGSWKVQVNADGAQGKGELAVPIAAISATSMRMQKSLGVLLAPLGLLLIVGLVGIISAANRDAVLEPGATPSPSQRRRGFLITTVAAIIVVGAVIFGNFWWTADASHTERLSYKLPHLQLSLQSGNVLQLALENPNNVNWRQFPSGMDDPDRVRLDDLIPDHGHILHLFLVRMPDMTSFWHLHPRQGEGANFYEQLPSLPAGHYQIFADIVHHTGFAETQVGEIDLPTIEGNLLSGDDAGGPQLIAEKKISQLSDGYRMVWELDSTPIRINQPTWFRFRIEDRNGNPATDLENYMGMAGHAAFIRSDGQVFAHVHPAGSISMAAAELAQDDGSNAAKDMSVAMTGMNQATSSAEITFPYGFPSAGDYHIFVQIKRAGKIETGSFLAHVEN